jgi:hypothetical protein
MRNISYRIEVTDDGNEVCIIPGKEGGIPFEHMIALTKMFGEEGYVWWLPSDERCGYLFSKIRSHNYSEKPIHKIKE